MATVYDAIKEIQDIVGAISGIQQAPDEPPEQMNVFPFAVCYAASGEYIWHHKASMRGNHNIHLEIHLARKDLPYDVKAAMAYCQNIPLALFNATKFGVTLTAVKNIDRIEYTLGPLGWGGTATIGFRFVIVGAWTDDAVGGT